MDLTYSQFNTSGEERMLTLVSVAECRSWSQPLPLISAERWKTIPPEAEAQLWDLFSCWSPLETLCTSTHHCHAAPLPSQDIHLGGGWMLSGYNCCSVASHWLLSHQDPVKPLQPRNYTATYIQMCRSEREAIGCGIKYDEYSCWFSSVKPRELSSVQLYKVECQ